jgi:hypothetical protein
MFLTPEQILQTAKRSEEINRQRTRDYFAELGDAFADALFDACMCEWRTGPAVTSMRLSNSAKDHILHAWQYRDDIAGVLLLRKDVDQFVPLFIHRPSLAHKLSDKTSLWINFRAIKEALECK